MQKMIEDNRIWFGKDGCNVPRRKTYLCEREGKNSWTWLDNKSVGHNQEATQEVARIFGQVGQFDYPKPVRLLGRIIRIATKPDSIILDSFAGTGTTAHAILNINKQDGGNRKFILIEMMEYAESITAERVKRVIQGYAGSKDEQFPIFDKELKATDLAKGADLLLEAKDARQKAQDSGKYDSVSSPKLVDNHLVVTAKIKGSDDIQGTGGNFSFYELGEAVVGDEGFNPSLTEEETKAYVWQTETRTKYVRLEDDSDGCLGVLNGQAVYLFHNKEDGEVFNRSTLYRMKHRGDNYVVYADACTFSEEELDRMKIAFRKIPRDVIAK